MSPRTILITSSNTGLDPSNFQALAKRSPSDHYHHAARSTETGAFAIQELRKLGVQAKIDVVEMDVADGTSVKAVEQENSTDD